MDRRPLTLTLSPQGRGEGTGTATRAAGCWAGRRFFGGTEREGRAVEVAGDGEGVGVSDAVGVDSAFDAEGNAVG